MYEMYYNSFNYFVFIIKQKTKSSSIFQIVFILLYLISVSEEVNKNISTVLDSQNDDKILD